MDFDLEIRSGDFYSKLGNFELEIRGWQVGWQEGITVERRRRQ